MTAFGRLFSISSNSIDLDFIAGINLSKTPSTVFLSESLKTILPPFKSVMFFKISLMLFHSRLPVFSIIEFLDFGRQEILRIGLFGFFASATKSPKVL